jgi:hypothetical protein
MQPRLKETPESPERARFFAGQNVLPADLMQDQGYLLHGMRRRNRLVDGWGILLGLDVVPPPKDGTPKNEKWVRVAPGYAFTPLGDPVYVADWVQVNLSSQSTDGTLPIRYKYAGCGDVPAAPQPQDRKSDALVLVIEAVEEGAGLVRAGKRACGTSDYCEATRLRDGFQFRLLALSKVAKDRDPYAEPAEKSDELSRTMLNRLVGPRLDRCFVALATIQFPDGTPVSSGDNVRREVFKRINDFGKSVLQSGPAT